MASSVINSDDGVISGTSGLKSSGGDDGNLVFQSKGTETARINTDKQIVAAAGTASLPALTTTGDLNTGIFFSAADTIDFVEGGTACGQFDSSANFKFNSGYGSVATAFGCRAWVNFNGTTNVGGNCTIRASGNVSTVADNGTGKYTVNFTNAFPDASYTVAGSGAIGDASDDANILICAPARDLVTYSTTACAIRYVFPGIGANANFSDPLVATAIFHR
jgi:hypothetical protein